MVAVITQIELFIMDLSVSTQTQRTERTKILISCTDGLPSSEVRQTALNTQSGGKERENEKSVFVKPKHADNADPISTANICMCKTVEECQLLITITF